MDASNQGCQKCLAELEWRLSGSETCSLLPNVVMPWGSHASGTKTVWPGLFTVFGSGIYNLLPVSSPFVYKAFMMMCVVPGPQIPQSFSEGHRFEFLHLRLLKNNKIKQLSVKTYLLYTWKYQGHGFLTSFWSQLKKGSFRELAQDADSFQNVRKDRGK